MAAVFGCSFWTGVADFFGGRDFDCTSFCFGTVEASDWACWGLVGAGVFWPVAFFTILTVLGAGGTFFAVAAMAGCLTACFD